MRFWPQSAALSSALLIPWLGRLATLAMLALLAWIGAGIFWSLTAPQTPRPATAMETDPQRAVQSIASRHLFGIAPVVTAASAVVSGPADIKLSGAIAAQQAGGRAFAILAIEGKPSQVVREGEEVMPGVKLQRVLSRQVELLRNGQTQMLNLPESGKGGAGQSPAPAATPVQPAQPGQPIQPVQAVQPAQPVQPIPAMQSPSLPEPGKPAQRRGKRIRSSDDES